MVNLSLNINESISNTFADQSLLISGCTGFLGKIILEKLLRCCPQIRSIYVLIRKKEQKKNIENRLDYLKQLPLFENLLKIQPNAFDKVHVIWGDISKLHLGLSESDRDLLISEITTILHVAATVRFDEPLNKAVLINVRGTREMLNLALKMTKLRVFLHVSTAYSNTDNSIIEEVVYSSKMNWRLAIEVVENLPESKLKLLTPFLLGELPNTYAFTKGLAENLVDDYSDKLPVVIVRPSVVTATYWEPINGWVDNFNGPIAMTFGVGIGLVHCLLLNRRALVDYIPADICVNIILATAWYRTYSIEKKTLIVNACASNYVAVSIETVIQFCESLHYALPFKTRLWYCFSLYTSCEIWYRIIFIVLHVIPGFFIDTITKFTNKPKKLMKIYRKMIFANIALKTYIQNKWIFRTDNLERLNSLLINEEKLTFKCDFTNINAVSIVIASLLNGRRFLLNEKENIDMQLIANYKVHRRFLYLHYGAVIVFWYLIWKLLNIILYRFNLL